MLQRRQRAAAPQDMYFERFQNYAFKVMACARQIIMSSVDASSSLISLP